MKYRREWIRATKAELLKANNPDYFRSFPLCVLDTKLHGSNGCKFCPMVRIMNTWTCVDDNLFVFHLALLLLLVLLEENNDVFDTQIDARGKNIGV